MKFVDKDTIVIDDIFPMYFKLNILRKEYAKLSLKENIRLTNLHIGGWGNGYVGLPFWHPWYKLGYDDIPVDVHGGLTFSNLDEETDLWIIGFDTNHGGDNMENRSFMWIEEETHRLQSQCLKPKKVQRIIKLNKLKNYSKKD